jgi:hypothetical protein
MSLFLSCNIVSGGSVVRVDLPIGRFPLVCFHVELGNLVVVHRQRFVAGMMLVVTLDYWIIPSVSIVLYKSRSQNKSLPTGHAM